MRVHLAGGTERTDVADRDLQASLVESQHQSFHRHSGGTRIDQHRHRGLPLGERLAEDDALGARFQDVRFNRIAHTVPKDALLVLELVHVDHRFSINSFERDESHFSP